MSGWWSALRRWIARPPAAAPRLARQQVLELARPWIVDAEGRGWDEPVRAEPHWHHDTGTIVWTVMTRANGRGGHIRLRIEDASGRLLERQVLPR